VAALMIGGHAAPRPSSRPRARRRRRGGRAGRPGVACHPTATGDLRRPSDPVVLRGSQLPRIDGVAPAEAVAFIRSGTAWVQIPVQVDEMHVANMGVVHNRGTVPATDHLVPPTPRP